MLIKEIEKVLEKCVYASAEEIMQKVRDKKLFNFKKKPKLKSVTQAIQALLELFKKEIDKAKDMSCKRINCGADGYICEHLVADMKEKLK